MNAPSQIYAMTERNIYIFHSQLISKNISMRRLLIHSVLYTT